MTHDRRGSLAVLRFEDALAEFQGLRIAGLIAILGKCDKRRFGAMK